MQLINSKQISNVGGEKANRQKKARLVDLLLIAASYTDHLQTLAPSQGHSFGTAAQHS